jgi:hypothetical protein
MHKKSMNYTDFEKAINYQSIVLALTLKQWGTKHMRTVDAKCTLAKAYLSNREPCIAQRIYSEALRAVTLYFPNAKATHDEIREHDARCADAERLSVGITQLASYMGLMHLMTKKCGRHRSTPRSDRLLKIANRRFDQKRFSGSVAAFEAWRNLGMSSAKLQDEPTLVNLSRYGLALMNTKRPLEAQAVFKQVVSSRNSQYAACATGIPLQKALLDWAESLYQSGAETSAAMTFRLAHRVDKPEEFDFSDFNGE